jgi:phenylacetate-CoA ligase
LQTPSAEQALLKTLNRLLGEVWENNPFYTRKWRQAGVRSIRVSTLAGLDFFPLTTRAELLADQGDAPPLGTNLTGAFGDLKRFHRTSGSTGAPMLWADSAESWQWVMHCSQRVWQLTGVQPIDRVMFLMPFGLSSGPWIIYEGACRLGCACIAAGLPGLEEQLRWLENFEPGALAGKPSVLQALGLAAKTKGTSPRDFGVRKLILTGERSLPVRESLEQLWGAECFDRYGLTEAGSVAGECAAHPGGLHLLDEELIAECIDPDTGEPTPDGGLGELVLTNLGRLARPIILNPAVRKLGILCKGL